MYSVLDYLTFLFPSFTGGIGIANLIKRTENKEYMGFGSLCAYRVRN